jgi:hypothetical protein
MQPNEIKFLETLQERAKTQAILTKGSPIPDWAKPFASAIGLHYWQFLLLISFVIAALISVYYFPVVYEQVTKIGN